MHIHIQGCRTITFVAFKSTVGKIKQSKNSCSILNRIITSLSSLSLLFFRDLFYSSLSECMTFLNVHVKFLALFKY